MTIHFAIHLTSCFSHIKVVINGLYSSENNVQASFDSPIKVQCKSCFFPMLLPFVNLRTFVKDAFVFLILLVFSVSCFRSRVFKEKNKNVCYWRNKGLLLFLFIFCFSEK